MNKFTNSLLLGVGCAALVWWMKWRPEAYLVALGAFFVTYYWDDLPRQEQPRERADRVYSMVQKSVEGFVAGLPPIEKVSQRWDVFPQGDCWVYKFYHKGALLTVILLATKKISHESRLVALGEWLTDDKIAKYAPGKQGRFEQFAKQAQEFGFKPREIAAQQVGQNG